MTFTDKLDSLMKRKNLNPHSLSTETGIPYMTIKNWYVRGVDSVKLSTVKVLADFFNVPLDYFGDDDSETDIVIKARHVDSVSHRITLFMRYHKINVSQLADMLSMDGNDLLQYISSVSDDEVSPEDDMLKK